MELVDARRPYVFEKLPRWTAWTPRVALIIRWSKVQILQGPPTARSERISIAGRAYRVDDGRWIAEALGLPGVMTYGQTREEAIGNTERLAIEAIADRIEHDELPPSALNVSFQVLREQLAGD
jgi:predicted RNase H-like HicB family nuclease